MQRDVVSGHTNCITFGNRFKVEREFKISARSGRVRTRFDIGVLSLGPTGDVIEFGVKTILVLNLSSPTRCRVAHNNLGKYQLAKLG